MLFSPLQKTIPKLEKQVNEKKTKIMFDSQKHISYLVLNAARKVLMLDQTQMKL